MISAKHENDEQPQSLTWNLLFNSAGEVRPELAYMLATDYGFFITGNPDLAMSGVVTDNDAQLEVVLLKPGEILAADTARSLGKAIASYLSCSEDSIDVNQLGYPPVPVALREDGTRGPSDSIPSRYLGHPVFWLPDDVLLGPDPENESQEVRAIRIVMELVARGVMNPETGDVIDVLVANGLDYRDPLVNEMLEAWRSGMDVPDLEECTLGPPKDLATAPGGGRWSLIQASRLVRDAWPNIELAELENLNGRVLSSIHTVEQFTLDMALGGFSAAGQKWFASKKKTIDNARLRQAVEDFGHTLAEVMGKDWAWLALYQKCRSEHLFGDASRIALIDQYDKELLDIAEKDIAEFQNQAEALLDDLFAAKPGTEQEKLTEVWNLLAAAWTRWVSGETSMCREVVNGWIKSGPIDISEFSIGPAPELPEEVPQLSS
jgi:hypothetical protein